MVSAMTTLAAIDAGFVAAFRSGTLTMEQALTAVPEDPVAMALLLLQLSAAVAAPASGAHQPSSATPPYAKPAATGRTKARGGKPGHAGTARPKPERIDRRETHECPCCPDCGGELHRTGRKRYRYIEDIKADCHSEAVEHEIHRDWCRKCKKQVEPKVVDALPNCTIGHRATTLSAWLHYGLGTTTSQVVELFNAHLQLKLSEGGLTEIWHRLAGILTPWYEQIQRDCLAAGVLHADETGWRVAGKTWWLWCFTSADATYYTIESNRGHEALNEFFVSEFTGVLVTDFWKAYDAMCDDQQKCWPHLLRDLKEIDERPDIGDEWRSFVKRLRRLYGDAIRLKAARDELQSEVFDRRVMALHERLNELATADSECPHALRIANRLACYQGALLTFVEHAAVPPSNNRAEREIRPAVLMRKASYGNATDAGAATRSVLMSVYRTLKLRGLDALTTTADALRTYTATGQLPPLPSRTASGG